MVLFNKIKKNVKKATLPKGMVSYRGVEFYLVNDEASLPDDKNILKQMAKYYNDYTVCKDLDHREDKFKMILKKVYPLIQNDDDRDSQIVTDFYFQYLCSKDNLNEHIFHTFINSIKNADVSLEELNKRLSQDQSVFQDGLIFSWFQSSKIEDEYVQQNIMTLVNAIWELVERERQEEHAIYLGYWMYKELYNYYCNNNSLVKFNKYLWKETTKYHNIAYNIYDLAPTYIKLGDKKKANNYLEKKPEFLKMNETAKNNLHLLNKEGLITRLYNIESGIANRDEKYEKGKMLLTSYLTEDEKQEGIALMKEAIELGHDTARTEMLEILAEANDPHAQALLATDLYEGRNNVKKDGKRAIELFRSAARNGSGMAYYYLSKAYDNGHYVLEDKQRAMSLLKESAKLDYIAGIVELADKEHENKNHDQAKRLYKKTLLFEETSENARSIKHAIARLVDYHIPSRGSHFDVDENTLALCSLVFDYVRLDAPIVSNYNLSERLEKAKKLDTSAIASLSLYYELESRGPMVMGTIPGSKIYNEDRERAYDMMIIHKSFELINIALHIMKLFNGEINSVYHLATAYFDGRNYEKARAYIDLGIELEIPSILSYVHKVWDKLDYDEWYAKQCLEKAASLGSKSAKLELEYQQMLDDNEKERKEYVQKILRDQEESRRTLKRIGFDLLERDIDLMLGGVGHNIDEKALLGELSYFEASNLRYLRKKLLEE